MIICLDRPLRPALALFFGLGLLSACGEGEEAAQTPAPPPAVEVMTLSASPVAGQWDFLGQTEAIQSVGLRAQVTGILKERFFRGRPCGAGR